MNYSLTTTQIKNAKLGKEGKAFKLSDGGGLHVYVSPTSAKLWRYKYRLLDKEYSYSLGAFPEVGLAEARERHGKARELVQKGVHPKAQREADKLQTSMAVGDTFKAVASQWFAKKKDGWAAYYRNQINTVLNADVYPAIGAFPIKSIVAAQILTIIKEVEGRGAPVVAGNILQWCSAIFRYAVVNLKTDYDPTVVLKGVIVRPKIKHNVALQPTQITDLLKQMSKFGGYRTTAIAIELLLLTFVRTVELRMAKWEEFDFENNEWRVPAVRMKMKVEHIVPLSKQAKIFLIELRGITGAGPHLFPNNRRPVDYMTATTINQALKRLGFAGKGTIGFSAHGFRGTATTLLHEGGKYRSEAIERQLSHAEGNKVKAAYNKAQYLPERQKMMQDWSDYVDTLRPENG